MVQTQHDPLCSLGHSCGLRPLPGFLTPYNPHTFAYIYTGAFSNPSLSLSHTQVNKNIFSFTTLVHTDTILLYLIFSSLPAFKLFKLMVVHIFAYIYICAMHFQVKTLH